MRNARASDDGKRKRRRRRKLRTTRPALVGAIHQGLFLCPFWGLRRKCKGLNFERCEKIKHPGAAKERIRRAIVAIVAYNDNAPSPNDRWYINPTVVQHLSGARFPIIQDYFAEHQADIDQENAEHELTPRYNHKPVGIKSVITVPEQPSGQQATLELSAQSE